MAKKRSSKKTRSRSLNGAALFIGILAATLGIFSFAPNLLNKKTSVCANSISCVRDLTGKYEESTKGVFLGREVTAPSYAVQDTPQHVLGTTSGPKHISVDLSAQRLYAYEGETKVYDFPVSTGKWAPTPTGEFKIWIKLRHTRMSGGTGADYYNLPNVPYTMFYYNESVPKSRGFSLHGAYWHNNFGYPMSHGCVNMRPVDAEKIFDWAEPATEAGITYATDSNPGTTVTVYGEAPK